MARTKSNGTNTSTATIGFEAGTDSSPELQPARAMASFDFAHLRFAPVVLANGSMSSNQSGDCPARSASSKPKAKPQSLPRQRDIRRALIEAGLVGCMVALPDTSLEMVKMN